MPTQLEYNVTKQRQRNLYAKINLLNYNFQTIDEISGQVIDYSFNIDSNSDVRRSCSISMTPFNETYDITDNGNLWIDKYIQVYIGIENIRTEEIVYTNMGIYIVNNPTQSYDATNNTINLSCLDLVAKLNGVRGGNLDANTINNTSLVYDSNIRNNILIFLQMGGITKYVVDECNIIKNLPYAIELSGKTTIWDCLTTLRDIAPQYQMYFDVNGIFHYNLIPSGNEEQVFIDNDIFDSTLISYEKNYDFESVHNVIEVYGATHEYTESGTVVSYSNNTYFINVVSESETLYDGMQIKVEMPSTTCYKPYFRLSIDNGVTYGSAIAVLYKEDENTYKPPTLLANEIYVFNYKTGTTDINYDAFIEDSDIVTSSNFTLVSSQFDFSSTLNLYCNNSNIPTIGHLTPIILNTPSDYNIPTNYNSVYTINNSKCRFLGNFETNSSDDITKVSSYDSITAKITNKKKKTIKFYSGKTIICPSMITSISSATILKSYKFILNIKIEKKKYSLEITVNGNYPATFKANRYFIKLPSSITYKKISGSTITASLSLEKLSLKKLENSSNIVFNKTIKLNGSSYIIAEDSDGLASNYQYKLKYVIQSMDDSITWLGNDQSYAIASEANPDNILNMNGTLGTIRKVCSGGEYDNIYTNVLANERAKWELYNSCKIKDSIALNCVPIYWCDVNKIINISLPNYSDDDEVLYEEVLYMVKSISISGGVNGTQTLNCMKYYPYYN